jgi:hypothetical protein
MSMRATLLILAGSLALTSGCSLRAPVLTSVPAAAEGVIGSQKQLTSFKGVAMAPASLIATNGSTLIADNASSLISDKASGYALLAVEALQPVSGAEVEVQDATGAPVPGVEAVKTDALGEFTLKNVPAGVNWVVAVKTTGFHLTTIVRPTLAAGGQPVTVDPATTAVTEHLRKAFGQEKRALRQVQPEAFGQLARAVKAKLDAGTVSVDLKPNGKAADVLELVAGQDGGIGQAVKAIVQNAQDAHATAKAKGQDTDDAPPVAQPTKPETPRDEAARNEPGNKPAEPPAEKPADKVPADPGSQGGDRGPSR